jgi:(1->4)-alpha-D-glucan 1-alpha-D-glucosylmutase
MPALLPPSAARGESSSLIRIPVSTCRIQLQPGFGFADAAALVPYLAELGVTDLYCSPYLRARAGSRHGYDICDHSRLNPELGGEDGFATLTAALHAAGMGQVADIVPNHMCIDPMCNQWWRDVLEHGRDSIYAGFFDIDWHPVKAELGNKVLLPVLGSQYGEALETGGLRLAFVDGAIVLQIGERSLPIDPRSMGAVLATDVESLAVPADDPGLVELHSVLSALRNVATGTEGDEARMHDRRRETELARRRLARLAARTPWLREHVSRVLVRYNGRAGDPGSYSHLHDLLETQAYRLASWRTSAHEINYRRFFDVDDLAGLRMEESRVFDATHALIASAIRSGAISGLRVDHPDGLARPGEYFDRLQRLAAGVTGRPADDTVIYVVAEKILTPGQELPSAWRVHGTTGYRFLNVVNGLFVQPANTRALARVYRQFTGQRDPFHEVAYRSRKLVMETSLASELNVLALALNRLSERNWRSRDFTLNSLRRALREIIACLSVYRTYVADGERSVDDEDRILAALARATRRNPELEPTIFDFIGDVLLDPPPAHRDRRYPSLNAADRAERLRFAAKLQQYTGPVHAKGIEDTAFYRYNMLLSLNEVGGEPASPGVSIAAFHADNDSRLTHWPLEMLATATHDTKLGEDVRARIDVLSEIPDRWRRAVSRWSRVNAPHRTRTETGWAPDRNDEYRLYQILVGIWPPEGDPVTPPFIDRVVQYMLKAIREAKLHTSWINQNEAYDRAVEAFVRGALASSSPFVASFAPFALEAARAGVVNSLAQCVLKMSSPGVPDLYQGTELWDLHLVDPDNRHPVDYELRRSHLASMASALDEGSPSSARVTCLTALLRDWPDGRIKMFVVAAALRLRRRLAPLFLHGTYYPLLSDPHDAGAVVAFARTDGRDVIIAAAPRLTGAGTITRGTFPVGDTWDGHELPLPSEWQTLRFTDVFTGASVPMRRNGEVTSLATAALFRTLPVALLRAV